MIYCLPRHSRCCVLSCGRLKVAKIALCRESNRSDANVHQKKVESFVFIKYLNNIFM